MSEAHPDDQQIERALHHELRPGEDRPFLEHLATCPQCRSRLHQAERQEEWLRKRFEALDHPPPRMTPKEVMARSRGRSRSRVAAGVVLALLGAGVAYAAPGSPLPALLGRLVGAAATAPDSVPVSTARVGEPAGIAVLPGERLTVVLSGGLQDTAVIVLHRENEVVVKSSSGMTTFDAGAERVVVHRSQAAGRVEILIPQPAPRVEVRSGSRRIFLKQGSRIITRSVPDSTGRYLIPLPQGRRPG